MSGPLAGVRVLDFSDYVIGPFCTWILGDMGADIVKVERMAGDTLRHTGPRRHHGMSSQFLGINRSKRSIAVDLKRPEGLEAVYRLAAGCDVLVHNMRRAAAERSKLDYESVRARSPRIVHCRIAGFGDRGRYRDKPAYDDIIQAMSGLAAIQARPGEPPRYVVSAIADKTPGLMAVASIAMALYSRERTGEGQSIEVPMFETMVSYVMSEHLYGKTFEPPLGPTVYPRQISAHRKPHKTADGYISVLVYTDDHWKRFFTLAGRPELVSDSRFTSISGRTENIDTLYQIVAEVMARRTTAQWLRMLEDADIPAMPLHTPDTLLEDPHLADVGMFSMIEHPTEGQLRDLGVPVTFSGTPARPSRVQPTLGQHSGELLAEAGYRREEIEALIESGVVAVADATGVKPNTEGRGRGVEEHA